MYNMARKHVFLLIGPRAEEVAHPWSTSFWFIVHCPFCVKRR